MRLAQAELTYWVRPLDLFTAPMSNGIVGLVPNSESKICEIYAANGHHIYKKAKDLCDIHLAALRNKICCGKLR